MPLVEPIGLTYLILCTRTKSTVTNKKGQSRTSMQLCKDKLFHKVALLSKATLKQRHH